MYLELSDKDRSHALLLTGQLKEVCAQLEEELAAVSVKEAVTKKPVCKLGSTESSPLMRRRGSKLSFSSLALLSI